MNDSTAVTLAPERLLLSRAYELVYHEDRVWIFRLAPVGSDG